MDRSEAVKPACCWVIGGRDPDGILRALEPVREAVPAFRVSLFLSPGVIGRPDLPSWATAWPLGWEGCPHECLAWTEAMARRALVEATELGYGKVFMPPSGTFDSDLLSVLSEEGFGLLAPTRWRTTFVVPLAASMDPFVEKVPPLRESPLLDIGLISRFNHFRLVDTVADLPEEILRRVVLQKEAEQ